MSSKSVTHWIQQLHGGDDRATQELWSRYFEKLVRLARKHLHPLPRRAVDEQDVALSAFNSSSKVFRKAVSPSSTTGTICGSCW